MSKVTDYFSECAHTSFVCFKCGRSFVGKTFENILFCEPCRNLPVLHQEENMKRKYRKVGDSGERRTILSEVENFYVEKDNLRRNTVFFTVDSTLPTVAEMNCSLDCSTFFKKFEALYVEPYSKPIRSKTGPRESYEELYLTEFKEWKEGKQTYRIRGGKLCGITVRKNTNMTKFNNNFSNLLSIEDTHWKIRWKY